MAMPVIGTIHNAGKLVAMEMKWQQKKKNGRGKTQQPAEQPAVEDRRDTQDEQELPDIAEIPETPELPGMAEQEDTEASETELSGVQPHTDLAEAAYSKLKAAL